MRRFAAAFLFSTFLVPASAWACSYAGHSVDLTVTPSIYYLDQHSYSTVAWDITLGSHGCEWWEYNTALIITGTDEFYYQLGQPHWGSLESDITDWLVVIEGPVMYHIDVRWWYTTCPPEEQCLFLEDDEKTMWVYDTALAGGFDPSFLVPPFVDEKTKPQISA